MTPRQQHTFHEYVFWAFFIPAFFILLGIAYIYYPEDKLAGAIAQPNEKLTPGLADPSLTEDYLCSHSTKERRKTTDKQKESVYALYGIKSHKTGEYEIDHRISLCAGGQDEIKNLWPQNYHVPGAHEKDRVEADVCRQICKGTLTPKQAQDILLNWYPYYLKTNKLGSLNLWERKSNESPIDPDDL